MSSRPRLVNPVVVAASASLVVLVVLAAWLAGSATWSPQSQQKQPELLVYCAAGMRMPIEEIAEQYTRAYGTPIRLQYGGSNALLSQIEVGKVGDLYLAADASYLQIAKDKGLVAETLPIAQMHPVVATPRGNAKRVHGVHDLLRGDVRVALANPDQAAMGKATRACMTELGLWDALELRVQQNGVFKPTVNDVANDLALGSVDAGIVWDAVAAQNAQLEIVRDPQIAHVTALVGIGVLTSTRNPTAALQFARFVGAKDRGQPVFAKLGYESIEADAWSERPQLTLFAGAINRQALDPLVAAFSQRHGVDVQTIYNGCGILTAQMRSIQSEAQSGFPDVYMPCDVYYMDTVRELFDDPTDVSGTRIVIAVQPGNPKGIADLEDLAKPGVRVALGQPQQCTIGVLSRRLLESAGIYEQVVKENVVTQTATSALLVPSIATGAADAALVYFTDAQRERENVEVVSIESPLTQVVQQLAIAKSSAHKQLSRLFFDAIADGKQAFEAAGFQWRFQREH